MVSSAHSLVKSESSGRPRANSPPIQLTGHTDERGEDAYNLKLSKDRSIALREHLEKNGYPKGLIEIDGLGESTLYQHSTAASLTQDEIWQVNRRVKLKRK
ncbi:MAG: OmpA family protein [Chitinophagales bacterium]|nr:OmpA family protein [Hyphomicrobiales bacterium]